MLVIVNKKTFALMVGIFFLSIICLVLFYNRGGILGLKKIFDGKNDDILEHASEIKREVDSSITKQIGVKLADTKLNSLNSYYNDTYKYKISFPKEWYIDTEHSDDDFQKIPSVSPNLMLGGQTILSNYENVGDYTPDNRPGDLHIISLSVYESSDSNSMEDFFKEIGFIQRSFDVVDFEAVDNVGKEIVISGEDKQNPFVAIVFNDDKIYYVFRFGFINGSVEAVENMESIVSSFSIVK